MPLIELSDVHKARLTLQKYYARMHESPGLEPNDRNKIYLGSAMLETFLDLLLGDASKKDTRNPRQNLGNDVEKFRILQNLCTEIENKSFPPRASGYAKIESLVITPKEDWINAETSRIKTSKFRRIIRDRNGIEEDQNRVSLIYEDGVRFLEPLVEVLRWLLPLHTIQEFTGIVSKPGVNCQALHADYKGLSGEESKYRDMPYWLFVACQDSTFLWFLNRNTKSPERIVLKKDDCIIAAGDAPHGGSAYAKDNLRFHVYIDSTAHIHDSTSQDFSSYEDCELPSMGAKKRRR